MPQLYVNVPVLGIAGTRFGGVTIEDFLEYTIPDLDCGCREEIVNDEEIMKKAEPRKLLLGELKNSTNLKLYKEAGYNFRYTYYSTHKKGTKLFEATFREKDYR